jgi:hypothetical protein
MFQKKYNMSDKEKILFKQINAFKRKYFLNLALKGLMIVFSALIILFIIINTLEYTFQFGTLVRAFLFFFFLGIGITLFINYIIMPAIKLTKLDKAMGDEIAAKQIGQFFPIISDKLLNIIQLRNNISSSSQLIEAGISQKLNSLPTTNYDSAITFKSNNRFLPWLIIPVFVVIMLILIEPEVLTTSTTRITNFNTEFVPKAPFDFNITNKTLLAFKNEDFKIALRLEGAVVPENVYLIADGRKIKMLNENDGSFSQTLKKIQKSKAIEFEAAGYNSQSSKITVVSRPDLRNFSMYLQYPIYLNKKNDRITNIGDANVPEGTKINWQFFTLDTDSIFLRFSSDLDSVWIQSTDNQLFKYNKTLKTSSDYQLLLSNTYSYNKDPITYSIDVIKDEYPKIENSIYNDTTFYSFISLSGNINDDYGLSRLRVFYSLQNSKYKSLNIPIIKGQNSQRYYFNLPLDSLVSQNQEIKYYLQVWDNDGINGSKSTKTAIYNFKIPSKNEIRNEIDKVSKQTENKIDKTLQESKELKKQLEEAEKKIKGKKELTWQDEKLIKDLIKKREQINQAIEELKEQNKNNDIKRDRFSEQDAKIKEKVQKLQELMDELLDEETKKLYDELKKLIEEKEATQDIQDLLDKINNKETNLEQELERTLELFKKMKFEFELNETLNELNEQIKDQKELNEKTEEKNSDTEQLSADQEDLNKEFENLKEQIEKLEESNQDLKNPASLPDTQEESDEIEKNQKESKESLDEGKKKKASEKQKKAIDNMKKMAGKMQEMQNGMEMEAMQENLEDLRAIVYNLLRLSFEQEDLMNEFVSVNQSDPRFIGLAQKQLTLKDDSQIVQDSLISLAKRVFQIASFVTREVTDMNIHMDKAVESIKERKKPIAVSEQQFAMTSINNLALLLDDVLQQMQNAMADAMGSPQKDKGKQKAPSLSELQKQLNNKIEELKGSGKEGRSLSEELAKLAAEQERIRKVLKEALDKAGENNNGSLPGNGITEKMEQTESDLVNKNLTQETINRQKEILTRLLEAEDALREKDLDEERKSESAKDYEKASPKAFEEYFKLKQQEIEFLKTIPPKLYPYYKNEVNEYFRRIEKDVFNTQSE